MPSLRRHTHMDIQYSYTSSSHSRIILDLWVCGTHWHTVHTSTRGNQVVVVVLLSPPPSHWRGTNPGSLLGAWNSSVKYVTCCCVSTWPHRGHKCTNAEGLNSRLGYVQYANLNLNSLIKILVLLQYILKLDHSFYVFPIELRPCLYI